MAADPYERYLHLFRAVWQHDHSSWLDSDFTDTFTDMRPQQREAVLVLVDKLSEVGE